MSSVRLCTGRTAAWHRLRIGLHCQALEQYLRRGTTATTSITCSLLLQQQY